MGWRPSALITGAASGIGLAVAEDLARKGYDLTLLDLDGAALAAAEARLRAHGASVACEALDVCDGAAQERAFRGHMARYGGMDVAVLNAGIGERDDFLLAEPSSSYHQKTLDIDLTAAIAGVRAAAHCMMRGGALAGGGGRGGVIIAVASAAGVFPVPAGPIYAAAKGGLVHFMRSVAPRLAARGITAAAVCPQYVDTPLVQSMLRDNPAVARAMMGPLFGAPLLKASQVAAVAADVVDGHRRAPPGDASDAADAGAGCVRVLLQNGKVVDPFAPRPKRGAGGRGGGAASTAAAAQAAAGALQRFSPDGLRAYASRQLPPSFRKLEVVRLTTDFSAATQIVTQITPKISDLPAGALLVRRLYTGINASDINYTSGRYHGSTAAAERALPYDAGFESVGVVVAAAPGVKGFPVGTPVATMERGFSEFGVHPANRSLRVPSPTPEVLALLTSGLTASIALEVSAGLRLPAPFPSAAGAAAPAGAPARPRTVLVTAAAGGTGQFAVQLAKLAGCRVVATCGGDSKSELLRGLGADRVINYRSEDVKAVLKAEYPGGIDVIYESVGGQMFDLCVDALADRGTLVVIGMMSQYSSGWKRSAHEGLAEKLLWKSAKVAGFFLLKYAQLWGPHLSALCVLANQDRLRAAIDGARFVGLDQAAAAVARLQSGDSSGKVVLQVAAELPPLARAAL